MVHKIAHVGVAVRDMQSSVKLFEKLFEKGPDHLETVAEQKVKTAMFQLGETAIELTEATDASSAIARFLEKRGEGVHHVSFIVDDIVKEIARLKSLGFVMVDEEPRTGAAGCYVAFLHPKSTNGVLIELSQERKLG